MPSFVKMKEAWWVADSGGFDPSPLSRGPRLGGAARGTGRDGPTPPKGADMVPASQNKA